MRKLIPRAPRREVESPVQMTFDGASPSIQGVSVNLSTTGMLVRSHLPKPRGTPLSFDFPLFEGRGQVVWSAESVDGDALLGMKFLLIGQQIDDRAPAEHTPAAAGGPGFAMVTDGLVRTGISLAQIAETLGVPTMVVHRARLRPSSGGYRAPPGDWRLKLAALARGRGEVLDRMAKQLRAVEGLED
jgi:hypothetical protein